MIINNKKIWLSAPHMGGEEIKFVTTAFETNWIAPLGPNVNGFEDDLVNYTHRKYAAAQTSGKAAIQLGLKLLGIKVGEGSLIGIGTAIIPGIHIGDWSILGAGSVVVENIPSHQTWVGNPAKPLYK